MSNVKLRLLILIVTIFSSCNLDVKSTSNNRSLNEGQLVQRNRKDRPSTDEIFEMMDADKNGLLAKLELRGPIREAFSVIDIDKDGFLSKEELELIPKGRKGRPKRARVPNPNIPEDDGEIVSKIHPAFTEFNTNAVTVYLSDDKTDYVIESTGLPNHETIYWGEGNDRYKDEPNVRATPSIILDRDTSATLTVDATPNLSGVTIDTELGIIGIAVSGSYIFNNEEGRGVINEAISSLDWTGGHIGPSVYHYHLEPKAFTNNDDNLVGILRDGVFIYGRKCTSTGTYPSDLDVSGGHISVTEHNTEEEYHYHIINELFANSGTYMLFEGPFQGY